MAERRPGPHGRESRGFRSHFLLGVRPLGYLLTIDRKEERLLISNVDRTRAKCLVVVPRCSRAPWISSILKALATGELHGLGVSRRVEQMTKGTFVVQPGSLFPALHRLEEAGWLTSKWEASENNRRAKYYTLTRSGRKQLGEETAQWNRIALAMARALET